MIINDILAEIISEVGGDASDTTLTTKMLGFFKAGYRHLPAFCRDRNFLGQDTLIVTSGTSTGDLDDIDGFIREREVWFVGDNLIHIPIYKPPSTMYWHKVVTPNSQGKPFYYRIYDRTIELDKKAAGDLTIGIDYFKAVSVITGTDTWKADEQVLEAAKHFCKMIYWQYEEDEAKAAREGSLAKALADKLEEEYEVEELGGFVDEKY